jgi:hypothetical protein
VVIMRAYQRRDKGKTSPLIVFNTSAEGKNTLHRITTVFLFA